MRGRRIKKTTICIVITMVTCLLVYFHNTLSADEDGTAKSVLRRQINQGQHLSRPTHISQKTVATDQNKSVVKKYNTTTKSETKHQDTRKSNEKYRGVPQNRKRVVKRHGRQHKRFGGSYSLDLRRRPVILADELDIDADWWRAFTELTEIDNDFRFDDEMATFGCEVHSFDPSMNVTEHKRESRVFFHKIGIGGRDDNMFRPWSNEYTINRPNNTWKIRTLASIMSKLGHRNKSLDILKLDIEGYEWEVLDSIIGDNLLPQIKQLEVEFHVFPNFPPRRDFVSALQVYQALWELDFKRIDNDFRFDDEMATRGCEVHSFDPSMNVTEHKRESGVFFHKIGIGGSDDNMFRPWSNEYTIHRPKNTWQIRTLASIMSKLGHINKSLDILKLDIEGYEWEVLDSIIGDNLLPQIKQLEVELHVFPNFSPRRDYVSALQVYQALWELDFKRYYSSVHQYHPNKDKQHLQADVAYVNTNYK